MRDALLVFSASLLLVSQVACTHPTGSGDAPPPASAATSGERESDPSPAPMADSNAKGPVVGTIVTHDAKVSILARGGDLRVIVRRSDGALVADGISLDELRTTDPTLHTIVTNAVASGHGATYIDATLHRMPASPSH